MQTTRIRMRRRASDNLTADDFLLEDIAIAAPRAGEVLTRTVWFSLDPYLASRMRTWTGAEQGWSEGIVVGRTLAEVIESRDSAFNVGDFVIGVGGWQQFDVRSGKDLQIVDASDVPSQSHLGALGSSGLTAWVGVNRVLHPQAGETAVVSSAAGLVGSIAGQILKTHGCRVIGIAGGVEKCRSVTASGFDDCVDHTAKDFAAVLARAVPHGIDMHFENVGAKTLDPALASINEHGRIALCGLIAHYQDEQPITLRFFRELLVRGITLRGFRIYDFTADYAIARAELRGWLKAGKLNVSETVTFGLEKTPQAYIDMLAGVGIGKHLVNLK